MTDTHTTWRPSARAYRQAIQQNAARFLAGEIGVETFEGRNRALWDAIEMAGKGDLVRASLRASYSAQARLAGSGSVPFGLRREMGGRA